MRRAQVPRDWRHAGFGAGLLAAGLVLVALAVVRPSALGRQIASGVRIPAEVSLRDLALEPIRQGNPQKSQVALAINVAWGNEYLPDLLAALKRHQAVGTFFLVGDWATRFPDLARRIADGGHEIASHGYTTVDYRGLSAEALRHQVDDSAEAIMKATGQRPVLFSPHKGEWTPELLALLEDRKYLPIHWTVDTVDWMNPSPEEMTARVLNRVGPGSIVLLHPTKSAVQGLDGILTGLENKGLQVVSVSALLDPNPLTVGGPSVWDPAAGVQAVWVTPGAD